MRNCFFILLFFTLPLNSQTVDALTDSLTKGIDNDSLKVVSIYNWVTKNIVYDHHFLRNRVEGDTALLQEPYNVVVRKKAICIGYAKLLKTMCRQVGIECVLVDGFAKVKNDEIDREEHAWNAVKINNVWYLMDATWDAGAPTSRKYFLSPPSVFLENHYPHDPMWQLTDNPISFDCFKEQKYCYPNKNSTFNYRDTINAWAQKDSLARLMDAGQRTLRYFPADLDGIRNLANGHSRYAVEAYHAYSIVRQDVTARRNVLKSQEEVLKMLDLVSFHLNQAQRYYEYLITFARKGTFTDAHINRDMMVENLLKLEDERKFVIQYIKK